MPARLTKYERLVTILTRDQKSRLIRYCDKNKYSAAHIMREALKAYMKDKGVDL